MIAHRHKAEKLIFTLQVSVPARGNSHLVTLFEAYIAPNFVTENEGPVALAVLLFHQVTLTIEISTLKMCEIKVKKK
jgi:hypothetical protein